MLAAAALVLVACGSDDSGDSGEGAATTSAVTPASSSTSSESSSDPLAPQPLGERRSVTVGWPGPFEVWASAIVADALGEFEAENLDVDFTTVASSDAIGLLEQGRLDVYVSSITAGFFNALHADANLRWVAPAFLPNPASKEGVWVANDYLTSDGQLDVAKFKGTKLGLGSGGPGASNAALVAPWLAEHGLSLDDFSFETVTGPDILIAMQTGAVSAGWLTDPYWVTAETDGLGQLLLPFDPDVALSGYIYSGELLGDADVAAAFTRALARANRDHLDAGYHEDPEVVAALADAIGVEPAELAAGAGYRFTADLAFDESIVTRLQETWLAVGDILEYDDPMEPAAVIDRSPVTEVS